MGHIAGELRVSDIRRWFERLARSFTIVRYDGRGGGSSDRDRIDESQAARVMDLEAVAGMLTEPAVFFAATQWAPPFVELLGRRPELASHLILWDPFVRSVEFRPAQRLVATRSMIEQDWRGYTDAWAHSGFGWRRAESAREWSKCFREGATPESTLARIASYEDQTFDVSEWLPRINAPTLVVGHNQQAFVDPAAARRTAAMIPGARLVVLDGVQYQPPMLPDLADVHARLIEEFVGVAAPSEASDPSTVTTPPSPDAAPATAGTAIILFADIVDSTAMTEHIGDAAFRQKSRDLDGALRRIIAEAGGTVIDAKTLGDGVLATFASAATGIDAALRFERAAAETGLQLHIGLHAGDVIREEGNIFGGAVNIAARISALSAPGEVLVSGLVRGLARTSAGVTFQDRGEHALKGIAEPQRIFAVRSRQDNGPPAALP
jgi:class 3 adenylate cyclase